MKHMLRFVARAIVCRTAYVDLDGCLLRRMPIPPHLSKQDALNWWMANLAPMPIVWHWLALLYVLRLFGVRLIIWTNRQPYHCKVTTAALGKHMWLFRCSYYLGGDKHLMQRMGPLMDDQAKCITDKGDWLVKQL